MFQRLKKLIIFLCALSFIFVFFLNKNNEKLTLARKHASQYVPHEFVENKFTKILPKPSAYRRAEYNTRYSKIINRSEPIIERLLFTKTLPKPSAYRRVPYTRYQKIIKITKPIIVSNPTSPFKPRHEKKYFVYSKNCHMPYVDPFTAELRQMYVPSKFKSCTNESHLVSVRFDNASGHYVLQLNRKVKDNQQLECIYTPIERKDDGNVIMSKELLFDEDELLPLDVGGIIVKCKEARQLRVVQEDAFAFVQMKNQNLSYSSGPRKPSVIMLGIDTMSRINFRRTMPLTAEHFDSSGWYEMQGYNKIGDNTLPNLLALLVGFAFEKLNNFCYKSSGCLDQLPFVWKSFKKSGYMTAFAEDVWETHVFNLGMPGFLQVPVDYYLRPFLMGFGKVLKSIKRFGLTYCIGRRLNLSYVLDYCAQFIQRYIFDRPIFGFFWTSSCTHSYYAGAASMDKLFLEYLKTFENYGLYEQAIVIVFSDHGSRFGDLMELPEAYLEERLPMLFIWLPPWFRKQYPEYAEALSLNQNRLTSTYDLHYTLKHIIQIGRPAFNISYDGDCQSCQSLLLPIPQNRNCEDAGISEHWCTCSDYIRASETIRMHTFAKIVILRINKFLRLLNYEEMCEKLILNELISSERKLITDYDGNDDNSGNLVTYRLKFETLPRKGRFQTTIVFNRILRKLVSVDITSISRLNEYKNDSYCVANAIAKKFCVCITMPDV